MSKQSFTTGQVLTAAQVNTLQANDFNQTVSVKTANYTLAAADKGTRIEFNTSGSVTCTVNSGLFDAGDTLVIQNRGAGTATITAGTATVNTSASLALAQYSAGTLYFVSDSAALFFGDAAGISASIVDAKGDLIVGTADNTVARLAVGTNGHTLVAKSSEATGLAWEAILDGTSFTPSFGGLTVGNGTNTGRFILQNKLLYVEGKFILGSTSSVTGQITLTLPLSKSFAVNNTAPVGFCRLEDTGTAFYAGNVVQNSSTVVALQRFGVTGSLIFYGSVDTTNPFTWATGDAFSYCFTCEVA
jgi:hypothetical protein